MALKITLKPHERMIIGGAVIANGATRSDFVVENNVPILREKDILSFKDADTACRHIYFSIQLMYVDEKNLAEHQKTYWELVKAVIDAAPSTRGLVHEISEHILQNKYYQALKLARKLIEYEQEAMRNVRKPASNI
jgi:flagellar biosynthesis repressor protein FlbT